MSNRNHSAEPSMEQILESISDIIADNGEDGQQVLSQQNELMPVSHAPVSLGNAPFDSVLQAHPVSVHPTNGSLTDRLANMDQPLEMRPVPGNATQAPPNFIGQPLVQNEYVEPVPVNMPVPQMTPHQPALSNGGFPAESAEDFLANNAQPVQQPPVMQQQQVPAAIPQPEFSVNQDHIAVVQQPVVQQPVAVMPVPVAGIQPVQPEPVVTQEAAPMENVVMQPNEVTATVPDTAMPSASHDVLNSFKQAEEQAIVTSEMAIGTAPGLLDAAYIPASEPAPLVADPVGIQAPVMQASVPGVAAPVPNVAGMDAASLEAAATAVVAEGLAAPSNGVSETQEVTAQQSVDSGFEGAVREMMKPMVKEWLDANLSKLVEDVVRSELTAALTKK